MKQTAVQWLASNLGEHIVWEEKIIDLVDQALKMEKEQIENAYNISWTLRDKPYATANKYYKETYEAQEIN